MLLVNLLAALNFADVFKNKKRLEIEKRKNVTKITKVKKRFFTSMPRSESRLRSHYEGNTRAGGMN